jgi:hypothetical protein
MTPVKRAAAATSARDRFGKITVATRFLRHSLASRAASA